MTEPKPAPRAWFPPITFCYASRTMDANASVGIAAAALGGAAIGIERQWSGRAVGPQARFAGIRTFTLLGLLAGTAG
jgi:uncharacterized membrane protein YhiD involved in acid resistance